MTQTAAVLLDEIRGGRWGDTLPGEHSLCAQLHVGRKTLRAALEQLRHDGVLKCHRGLRRRIVSPRPGKARLEDNRIVLLMPAALEALNPFVLFLVDSLRQHLAEENCRLETHALPALFRARSAAALENLSKTLHPAGWVLVHSTERMQQWFAERRLPCVVVGSRYSGVRLSCVDMDYDAVCQHAVNQFVSRGHRRLALVSPLAVAAGDARTEAGFLQAVAQHRTAGVQAEVVNHDGRLSDICLRVDSLRSRSQPPTAFLVSRASHFLTVLTHLLNRRVRVPDDVALISREHYAKLEDVVPTAARYYQNPTAFAANASRLVMGMIRGAARVEECKIMPQFIRGDTLG